jgi:sec-independent protein translocase protein TatB
MFDIGFTEMMFIVIVALIVIGPEKLPKVTRTLGHLLGRAQRYVSDVKSEINREMEIEDLRKLQAEMQSAVKTVETQVKSSIGEAEDSLRKETSPVKAEIDSLQQDLEKKDEPEGSKRSS